MVKLLIIACYEKIGIFILGSGSCTNILATCIIYNAADHFTYMHGIKHTTICHILYNLNIFMETRHICTTKISCVILITPMKSQGFTNMRKRWTRKGTIFSAKKNGCYVNIFPISNSPNKKSQSAGRFSWCALIQNLYMCAKNGKNSAIRNCWMSARGAIKLHPFCTSAAQSEACVLKQV